MLYAALGMGCRVVNKGPALKELVSREGEIIIKVNK